MESFHTQLEEALPPERPALVWIHQHPGMHARTRIQSLTGGRASLYLNAPSLSDRLARRRWCSGAEEALGVELDPSLDWRELLMALPRGRRLTLIFDDVSGLLDARRDWGVQMGAAWNAALQDNVPLHLILVDSDARTLEKLRAPGGPFQHPAATLRPELGGTPGNWLTLESGDFGALARTCPGWSSDQVALGYGLFGASDHVLERLDPGVRVSTNTRRLLLSPEGPLFDYPLLELRRCFQSPERYAGVLRALASGGEEWKDIVAALEGELPANALAPYVARLRDWGLMEDRRSLDAPARSRRRRYGLTDPLSAFWWSEVSPMRDAILAGSLSPEEGWVGIRVRLGPHMDRQAPRILRTLIERYSSSILGAPPREVGGLWGDGYDIPTATTLTNGAVAYSETAWGGMDVESGFSRIETGLRYTRYGYGREARLRIVLAQERPDPESLRRIRRDPLRRLVTLEEAISWARAA